MAHWALAGVMALNFSAVLMFAMLAKAAMEDVMLPRRLRKRWSIALVLIAMGFFASGVAIATQLHKLV